MNGYYFKIKNVSFCGMALLISSLLLLVQPISCASSKKDKAPEFKILELKTAKGISDTGKKEIILNPTDTFSSIDTAVVAHASFANLSGKHSIIWKWFSPDGKLYYRTKKIQIKAPKGKYAADASSWHNISIEGEKKAAHLPGQWRVELYLDDSPVLSKQFEIKTDISDIAFDVDLNIPKTKMNKPNAVAVVIGNRYYRHKDIPEVKYAQNDADVVKNF